MTGIDQINLFKWLVGMKLEPNNCKILKLSAVSKLRDLMKIIFGEF